MNGRGAQRELQSFRGNDGPFILRISWPLHRRTIRMPISP